MDNSKFDKGSGSGASYSSYGGNYGSYGGYGYGGGPSADSTVQRSFQDYVLILRERVWYIVVVFLLVFSSAVVYTFTRQKAYLSTASVQVLRNDPIVMQVVRVVNN